MHNTVAIIQARLGSTRLPGKVLFELAGQPMIGLMISRVQRALGVDKIVLAIADGDENNALAEVAERLDIAVFRGPEHDVLARYAGAAEMAGASIVVRLTGDCPIIDPVVISAVLELRNKNNLDYCTNVHPPSWPDGLDVSVFTRRTLERAHELAKLPSEREHVVPWMWANSSLEGRSALKAGNLMCPENLSAHRWTVDTSADYLLMRELAALFGPTGMVEAEWRDFIAAFKRRPDLVSVNANEMRDAGLTRSQALDQARAPADE